MSLFKTSVPVDIRSVVDSFPPKSTVISVNWNPATKNIEIVWESSLHTTPYTFPVEFSVEDLKSGKLPEKVKLRLLPTPPSPQAIAEKSVDTTTRRGVRKRST